MEELFYYFSTLLSSCFQINGPGPPAICCSSLAEYYVVDGYTNVTHLSLVGYNRQMATLKNNSFIKYPDMNYIFIHAAISDIEPGAFDGLNDIKTIELKYNSFHVIKAKTFKNISVSTIDIWNCEVNDIEPGAFMQLSNIQKLTIYKNTLTTIKKGVFSDTNIAKLYLIENKINNIEEGAFSGMKYLKTLNLKNNALKYFDPSTTIGHSSSLRILIISENKLTALNRKMFSVLPNLEVANLTFNMIGSVGDQAFADLLELWILDLSNNQINEIRPDIFPPNSNLTNLFLHNNYLTHISPDIFPRLPNLGIISIDNDHWQTPCLAEFKTKLHENNVRNICQLSEEDEARRVPEYNINSQCDYSLTKQTVVDSKKKSKILISCYTDYWEYYAWRGYGWNF